MIIGARYLRGRHASGGFDSLLNLEPFLRLTPGGSRGTPPARRAARPAGRRADYVARATRRTGRTEADAHGGGSGAIYHRPGPVL